MKPLAIDIFCGLGGWTEGLLAEGYRVVGFDIERHVYGEARYPAQLVLQDALTIHGAQFKDAALIVASPPCQEFSYMAMPWTKAKEKARRLREGEDDPKRLTALFDACFRIQREACEAAWRHVPLVVENVRGAQPWVGRARWHFGSFYLWGDVPALMPMTKARAKVPSEPICDCGHPEGAHETVYSAINPDQPCNLCSCINPVWLPASRRTDVGNGVRFTTRDCGVESSGIKQGGDWFNDTEPSISRKTGSKSTARKAASAHIAKIPLVLAQHIARVYYPHERI